MSKSVWNDSNLCQWISLNYKSHMLVFDHPGSLLVYLNLAAKVPKNQRFIRKHFSPSISRVALDVFRISISAISLFGRRISKANLPTRTVSIISKLFMKTRNFPLSKPRTVSITSQRLAQSWVLEMCWFVIFWFREFLQRTVFLPYIRWKLGRFEALPVFNWCYWICGCTARLQTL